MEINFALSEDGKSKKLYDIFTSLKMAIIFFYPKYLCGSCVADGAAKKVEVLASVEARLLFMHTGYKVGSFSVGNLVRTKIKVAINPFPEVNNLISKAHKFLTHFSYGSHRYNQL